jgi:hypothetical protein
MKWVPPNNGMNLTKLSAAWLPALTCRLMPAVAWSDAGTASQQRYEHHYFRGFVVATKRRGKRWVEYFSDKPDGRAAAHRRAREYRDALLASLPRPTKLKRTCRTNLTGVIGVARVKESTRSGRPFVRYVASWPREGGARGKASFSVALYGEADARRLAVKARRAGVEAFMRAGQRTVKQSASHRTRG